MSMVPQGPKAGASSTFRMEPATAVAKWAATTELPLCSTKPPIVREQDRMLPVANVSRIMRRVLPPHAKISEDAKEVVQDCVSEFISFITGEANERCGNEHRKTVTVEDIVWAMNNLGFEDYVGPLKVFLHHMRDSEGGGRGSSRVLSLYGLPGDHMRATVHRSPAPPAPPQAYVPHPVPTPASSAAPYFGGRYQQVSSGELRRSMAPYYGGAAFQAGGSHRGAFQVGGSPREFYTDEEASSSSNGAPPAPRAIWRH